MLLGIDLGTGSAKALLLDIDGKVIAEASSAYPVKSPEPGWAETDPEDWWNAVAIAIHQVVPDGSSFPIQAIGLSGQMHGVILCDRSGQPLRSAILWADARSSETLEAYHRLSTSLQVSLANPITVGMAGPTLLWLQEQEPQIYAAANWMMQPKDWLRLQLTGEVCSEPSDASGTLLYDVLRDQWAVDVANALGLRTDWFPSLIPSHQIAGTLTKQAAAQLGLPAGIPVVAGAADTAAAALGSGLLQSGQVQLTVGTGAQLVTPLAQPVEDATCRTHLYRGALPQQWYRMAAMQNAGIALEWVRGMLGFSWPEVYAEISAIAPGCEGLTFLPYLTGERTPHLDPNARGAWAGLGLHHTRSHLMRAALEGVAFAIGQGMEAIAATGIPMTALRLAGGGTLEPTWRQLLADVLQVPLYSVTVPAASARGAAILAGMGTGVYVEAQAIPQPALTAHPVVPASSPEWEEARQRFRSLYPALHQWAAVA